jgi:hypothetical protein
MKEMKTETTTKPGKNNTKKFSSAAFDFVDIDKRLQELKELEKKLVAELEK